MILKAYFFKKNVGHGNARKKSISLCKHNIVALMDSDDISDSNRFAKQLSVFLNKDVSVVGGQISEFHDDPEEICSYRNVELTDFSIKKDLKKRCPFNQMTVMFKKDHYDSVGGYIDWFCNEDYYLWTRMYLSGLRFMNLPDILVNVRANRSQIARRRGGKYFKSECRFQKYLLKNKVINHLTFLFNVFKRFVGELIIGYLFPSLFFKIAHSRTNKYEDTKETKIIKTNLEFSVAMCVYGKDNVEWFVKSIESVINQTVQPAEIVLVVDGPIPTELEKVIYEKFEDIIYEE